MKNLFAAPIHERIELAVKKRANIAADVEYRRLLAGYYLGARDSVDPTLSVADAYEYARLFDKHDENLREQRIAESRLRDVPAQEASLRRSLDYWHGRAKTAEAKLTLQQGGEQQGPTWNVRGPNGRTMEQALAVLLDQASRVEAFGLNGTAANLREAHEDIAALRTKQPAASGGMLIGRSSRTAMRGATA